MALHVAMLRGINVAGHRPLPMADLRRLCESLGLVGPRTYLQSGNVVFGARSSAGLGTRIAAAIGKKTGLDVAVLVLGAGAFARVLDANPLVGAPGVDEQYLHATFLGEEAGPDPGGDHPTAAGERVELRGTVAYLYCPNGYGNTRLGNAYFERRFRCRATTRNWRTLRALGAMAGGTTP
jgi:uncharacterized protein (DUF1697 family)